MLVSERVWNLTRALNMRETEGYGRGFDKRRARVLEEPTPSGPSQDSQVKGI